MELPLKDWAEMDQDEQRYFLEMPREDIIDRWHTDQGIEIKKQLCECNHTGGGSSSYSKFLGTVKLSMSDKRSRFDLRGLDLRGFSNLVDGVAIAFDFSNCLLRYSDCSGSILEHSKFSNSDIVDCDFSNSELNWCDFSGTNLYGTNFKDSELEYADFRNADISYVSLENANLGFIKYNYFTGFKNINVSNVRGCSSPRFVSFIRSEHYLKHFQGESLGVTILFRLWRLASDCGQSLARWSFVSLVICGLFGYMYSFIESRHIESFLLSSGRSRTWFTFYYFSTVTFTTLGFGDVVPNTLASEFLVTFEVLLGYVMLGGLISIFATKFIPKI